MTKNQKPDITLFTIGFGKKSAQEFFEKLQQAGVRRLVDTRRNNVSQLAGFTKKRDLAYFLRVISGIDYAHVLDLAPTEELLALYRKKEITWQEYEREFRSLLERRRPAELLQRDAFDRGCLLCSEPTPEHCHRRLVAEHLKEEWGNVVIKHLI